MAPQDDHHVGQEKPPQKPKINLNQNLNQNHRQPKPDDDEIRCFTLKAYWNSILVIFFALLYVEFTSNFLYIQKKFNGPYDVYGSRSGIRACF